MAKKSLRPTKKKTFRKSATSTPRTLKSRYVSFFVGVVTVLLVAFLIFQYAQTNNYKQVLGEKTNSPTGKLNGNR